MVVFISLCVHLSSLNAAIDAISGLELVIARYQQINRVFADEILLEDGFIKLSKIPRASEELRLLGVAEPPSGLSRENIEILLEACCAMTASLDWNQVVGHMLQKFDVSNSPPPLENALLVALLSGSAPKDRILQIECDIDDACLLAALTHGGLGTSVVVRYRSGHQDTIRFGNAPEQVAVQIVEGSSDCKVSLS